MKATILGKAQVHVASLATTITFIVLSLMSPTAHAANIVWVSDAAPGSANSGVFSPAGSGYTDSAFVTLLQNAGHNVIRFNGPDSNNTNLTTAEITALNTNDLIIIGRATGSGAFQLPQGRQWNTLVTKPLVCMSQYLVRTLPATNRMGWFVGDVGPDDTTTFLTCTNTTPETDFLFGGVEMLGTNTVSKYNEILDRNTSHILTAPVAGGIVYSTATFAREDNGTLATSYAIVGFPAGTPVRGGFDILAGYRMSLAGGSREGATAPNAIPLYTGRENLTPAGEDIFLRAVQLALNSGVPPATDPAAPIGFTAQPTSATVLQGFSASFSVAVTGAAPRLLEWQRDSGDGVTFTNIPDAYTTFSRSRITLTNLTLADNGAKFRVSASNALGTVISDVATLTVNQDIEGPIALSAGSVDGQSIGISFNETIDPGTATDGFNYSVDDGAIGVNAVAVRPDGRSVVLSLAAPLNPTFSVTVVAVQDRFGNVMTDTTLSGVNLGLTTVDVGALNPGGTNFSSGNNSFELTGGGLDIAGTADTLRFAYKTITGDFDARIRVTSLVGSDRFESVAKAALVARASTVNNAGAVTLYVTPPAPGDFSVASIVRTTTGGATAAFGPQVVPNYLPNAWLRIVRLGNTFTTYHSANGTAWTQLGSTNATFGASIVVGAGVVSHRNGRVVTGNFSDFSVVPLSADLSITKTTPPGHTFVGSNVTYTITVANGGPDAAGLVTVTDTIPAGSTFVSATASQGTCSQAAGVVTCNLGSLASGASATITLVATMTAGGSNTNTATVTSSTIDPDTANNGSALTVYVYKKPVLGYPYFAFGAGTWNMLMETENGLAYRVEYKDTLLDPAWKTVVTFVGDGNPRIISDDHMPFGPTRFYRVVADDPANSAPTISPIPDQTTNEDTATGPIAFTIGDNETPASSLIVSAVSSNTALVSNAGLAIGGSGANRTLTAVPEPDANGTTTITVTVSDGALSASTSFVLTVTAVDN